MDNKKRYCKHWLAFSNTCSKTDGGLFIPMENHIEIYCTTSDFILCPQFSSYKRRALTGSDERWQNRRSSVRIHQQKLLSFLTRTTSLSGIPPTTESEKKLKAKTLDLSMGGMRIFTANPLSENSLIEFLFGKEFPAQLRKVLGKVCWCNRQINEPGYQIGVAFTEGTTKRAMEHYLNNLSFA